MNIENNGAILIQQIQHPLLTGSAFRSSGGATADHDKHGESVIVAFLEASSFQMAGQYNVIFRETRNARTDSMGATLAAMRIHCRCDHVTRHLCKVTNLSTAL